MLTNTKDIWAPQPPLRRGSGSDYGASENVLELMGSRLIKRLTKPLFSVYNNLIYYKGRILPLISKKIG